MANSDKNVVITPNIGSTTDDPKIVFSAADANYGAQNITIRAYPVNNGTLSFEGAAGQILSVSNNYVGNVFSANDLSGTPYIEVLDSGLVRIAQYPGNVVIGSPIDNGNDKLQVSGSIYSSSIVKASTLTSTATTGTAPLNVTSTTMVSNLNAQYWNGNGFASYLNQGVRTGDAPTFDQVYVSGWFRNNGTNNGLYNQNSTQHWSSGTNGYWDASSTTTFSGIRFYTGSHLGALRGYVYANNSNEIGFLNTAGNWSLRCDNSFNVQVYGALTVGSSTSADIYMTDTDNTTRRIHCNSNRIGFLNSGASWGAYCDNTGNWISDFNITAYSDIRAKTNIEPIRNAIEKVKQLRGVTYDRIDNENIGRQTGVIAQEVLKVLPEAVIGSEETSYSVAYGNMVGLLIEAIKEQQAEIEEMKNLLRTLNKTV